MKRQKSNLYLAIFVISAFVLGYGVWKNYRPQVVYASCADIAEKTTNLVQKKNIIPVNEEQTFDDALNNCLMDAGYFNE